VPGERHFLVNHDQIESPSTTGKVKLADEMAARSWSLYPVIRKPHKMLWFVRRPELTATADSTASDVVSDPFALFSLHEEGTGGFGTFGYGDMVAVRRTTGEVALGRVESNEFGLPLRRWGPAEVQDWLCRAGLEESGELFGALKDCNGESFLTALSVAANGAASEAEMRSLRAALQRAFALEFEQPANYVQKRPFAVAVTRRYEFKTYARPEVIGR
jgi:hypothetical protein